MSLLKRAEAFLLAKAAEREEAVSQVVNEARSDLVDAYQERLAMVLEAGDISEVEAHRIAAVECGASFSELKSRAFGVTVREAEPNSSSRGS